MNKHPLFTLRQLLDCHQAAEVEAFVNEAGVLVDRVPDGVEKMIAAIGMDQSFPYVWRWRECPCYFSSKCPVRLASDECLRRHYAVNGASLAKALRRPAVQT